MGPCLWGTEYRMIRDRIKWANELQWGRAFGARNTLILLILLVATTSFNGAVPLGHGIQHHHVHREQRQQRFNGAVPLGHGIPPASQSLRSQGVANRFSRGCEISRLKTASC